MLGRLRRLHDRIASIVEDGQIDRYAPMWMPP